MEPLQDSQEWDWFGHDDATISTPSSTTETKVESTSSAASSSKGLTTPQTKTSLETPRSSKSGKNLHIERRKLNFRTTSENSKQLTISVRCCEEGAKPVDVILRDIDDTSIKFANDPLSEIVEILGSVPLEAMKWVKNRRAVTLPFKCLTCKKWSPPLYRCDTCGLLMNGSLLDEHEYQHHNEQL